MAEGQKSGRRPELLSRNRADEAGGRPALAGTVAVSCGRVLTCHTPGNQIEGRKLGLPVGHF